MLPIKIASAGSTYAQDAVIETNPASGPVIINNGSGFFKIRMPIILDKMSPKDADKKVLIKINGIFKSIAPLAPPLNPNQPNQRIRAPSAAIGVLLP